VKKILEFDYDDHLDFSLIGIYCAHKDFRLCFEINKTLEINLSRADDLEMKKEKRGSLSYYSLFNYHNGDNEQYFVIANKGTNGTFINELKHVDYFMLIKNLAPFNSLTTIAQLLKEISIITGVAILDATEYKSAENFLIIDEIKF